MQTRNPRLGQEWGICRRCDCSSLHSDTLEKFLKEGAYNYLLSDVSSWVSEYSTPNQMSLLKMFVGGRTNISSCNLIRYSDYHLDVEFQSFLCFLFNVLFVSR